MSAEWRMVLSLLCLQYLKSVIARWVDYTDTGIRSESRGKWLRLCLILFVLYLKWKEERVVCCVAARSPCMFENCFSPEMWPANQEVKTT